jgi:hypothetical protein
MRWLWKYWPQPVTVGVSQNTFLKDILVSGEGWQAVPDNDPKVGTILADLRKYRAFGRGCGGPIRTESTILVDTIP